MNGTLAAFTLLLVSGVALAAPVESTFDAGDEGWTFETRDASYTTIFTSGAVTYVDDGLLQYIRVIDPTSQFTVFRAPAAYEGDQSDKFFGFLEFEQRTNTASYPPGFLVVVFGGGASISAPIPTPTLGQFETVTLPFDDGTTWRDGTTATGAAASDATIQTVLGSVTALLIGAEFGADAQEEVVELDRVLLVPSCIGDVDGDGDTDVFDFADLASSFGAGPGATRAQGDLNGDGFVDVFDFADLASDFGCGS